MPFLLIDKPAGITSHDVVHRVRKITGEKKVGHAGTLDPLATGLLLVAIGRASTKRLGEFLKKNKTYKARIKLGAETDTDDSEGAVVHTNEHIIPTKADILAVLQNFHGDIEQLPPAYSALKIRGKKAYEIARDGGTVTLAPRRVQVHTIELTHYEYPYLEFEVSVSSGTYIRSLARDIGRELGTYGHIVALRRTSLDRWSEKDAVSMESLSNTTWTDAAFEV